MIALWWVGEEEPDDAAMEHAREHLQAVFETEVRRAVFRGVPAEAFDPRRRQTSSTKVVQWLASQRPPDFERVLGVLGADLFIPVLTFVFGEAQLGGTAAVVSTARLVGEAGELGRKLLLARLAKECVHELGHTYGLVHCNDHRCAMSRSAGVIDVDTKTAEFCRDCRTRVADVKRGLKP